MSDYMQKRKEEHLASLNLDEVTVKAESGDLEAIGEMLTLYDFLGKHYDDEEDANHFTYWLKKAAEAGNENCMKLYGYRMIDEENPMRDTAEAILWLDKAGETGDINAIWELAHIYECGLHGIQKDIEKSKYWYSKAVEAGDEYAGVFVELVEAGKDCPHSLKANEKRETAYRLALCFPYINTADAMYAEHKDYKKTKFTDEEQEDCKTNKQTLKDLADIAREQGFLAWEPMLPDILDPFLKGAMTLLVDGVEPKIVEYVLNAVVSTENLQGAQLLSRLIYMWGMIQLQNGNHQILLI
jgi:TPR repeat protein